MTRDRKHGSGRGKQPGQPGRNGRRHSKLLAAVIAACIFAAGVTAVSLYQNRSALDSINLSAAQTNVSGKDGFSLSSVPKYSGSPTVEINNNKPDFSKSELRTKASEKLGQLDSLGRCTTTTAVIGKESMPKGKRGSISEVHPTGWKSVRYKSVDGGYLYNRCHLIGWQLTGDDAIPRNLITGTRYMNVEGMEPYESKVAEYIRSSGNHVVYRSTPIFKGDELVARGVHLEAESVEDKGRGISFNIFCYNVQPGIVINYKTGDSHSKTKGDKLSSIRNVKKGKSVKSTSKSSKQTAAVKGTKRTYVINENTGKFHKPSCPSVSRMSEHNKKTVKSTRKALIQEGYSPCQNCQP